MTEIESRKVAPIDRLLAPLVRLMHAEVAGGIVLVVCTLVALVLANSPLAGAYHHFWETEAGIALGGWRLVHSLEHWINDGLMVVFFFAVGLEVKRELVVGELRDPRRAALPIVAALGGMVVPAGIYLALQGGGPAARGWGIPMATDIAFVVGCMALLGSRVPLGLRAMLLSFAIMPIFALANAGVPFRAADLVDPVALAVAAGLVVGKPVGILVFSWIAVRAGLARLPAGVGWSAIAGAGLLAGIGFTMALFIAGLALPADGQDAAKVGILAASALAAGAGMAVLASVLPARPAAS